MDEATMLKLLRRQAPEGLTHLIRCYNGYAAAIIRGILGNGRQEEDVEELVSDVFVAIWRHADALKPGKVKAYIGTTARNMAKSFLRKKRVLPMDLDELPGLIAWDTPEARYLAQEQAELVRQAVEQMGEPNREIFLRYYYYLQPTEQIAKELNMEPGAVRARLMRGRNALKAAIWKEDTL